MIVALACDVGGNFYYTRPTSWGKDTDRGVHSGVFSMSHFAPVGAIDGARLPLESAHFSSQTLFCHSQGVPMRK